MKQKNSFKKISAAAVLSALFLVGLVYSNPVEANSCKKACVKYKSCTISFFQKNKDKMTPSQKRYWKRHKKNIYSKCLKVCRKHSVRFLKCYRISQKKKNSCYIFWRCGAKSFKKK